MLYLIYQCSRFIYDPLAPSNLSFKAQNLNWAPPKRKIEPRGCIPVNAVYIQFLFARFYRYYNIPKAHKYLSSKYLHIFVFNLLQYRYWKSRIRKNFCIIFHGQISVTRCKYVTSHSGLRGFWIKLQKASLSLLQEYMLQGFRTYILWNPRIKCIESTS